MEDKDKKSTKVEIIEFNNIVDSKEEKPKISDTEKEEIKKILTRLLTVLVIFGTLFLTTILFLNSNQSSSDKKKESKTDTTLSDDEKDTTTEDILDGDIGVNSDVIRKYKNILTINNYDTVFSSKIVNIFSVNDFIKLDNINKLYLATNSESFMNYLEGVGLSDHGYNCAESTDIEFNASVMKDAIYEVFGEGFNYKDASFQLPYYLNGALLNVYDVTYNDGKYTMKCIKDFKKDLELVIQTKLNKVTKINNQLILEMKVVFINKKGVYSDSNTTKLITDDTKSSYAEYIEKGQSYKFIFEENNNNYYLKSSVIN